MIRRPTITIVTVLAILAATHMLARPLRAEKLSPPTVQAWDRYLAWVDAKVQKELSDPSRFLIEDYLPEKERLAIKEKILSGAPVTGQVSRVVPQGAKFDVPDGEIHHWWGAILVPGVKLPELMSFLKDYDHHAGRFADVERSRLLSHQGNRYKFYFRLKRKKSFVTAHYNTEQECVYSDHGNGRISSRSYATKIAEIEDPGTSSERERPPGDDHGYLWRLASWWRFEEVPQGVIVECASASLSRDIPAIVRFIPGVSSYIRSTPKESLESVLLSIRANVRPR